MSTARDSTACTMSPQKMCFFKASTACMYSFFSDSGMDFAENGKDETLVKSFSGMFCIELVGLRCRSADNACNYSKELLDGSLDAHGGFSVQLHQFILTGKRGEIGLTTVPNNLNDLQKTVENNNRIAEQKDGIWKTTGRAIDIEALCSDGLEKSNAVVPNVSNRSTYAVKSIFNFNLTVHVLKQPKI